MIQPVTVITGFVFSEDENTCRAFRKPVNVLIMAIILNILLIILEIAALKKLGGIEVKSLVYYTLLSNMAALISSVIFIVTRGSVFSVYLRYLSVCMLIMTALVSLCILAPMGAGFKEMMLSGSGLYLHTLCPAVCVISYVFFEPHVHAWILPASATLGYGIIMMALNAAGKIEGPYPFFKVYKQSRTASVLWMILLFTVISVISFIVAKLP